MFEDTPEGTTHHEHDSCNNGKGHIVNIESIEDDFVENSKKILSMFVPEDDGSAMDWIESTLEAYKAHILAQRDREIVEIIKSNSPGSFVDEYGESCWFRSELLSLINKKDV